MAALDELLPEFQTLWDDLNNRLFDLGWHSLSGHEMVVSGNPFSGPCEIKGWKGWSAQNPPFDLSARSVVGRLSLPSDDQGNEFTLGIDVVTLPNSEDLAEVRKRFQALSAQAGAAIPAETRSHLARFVGDLNSDPAAWWYALLFATNAEPLYFKQGERIRFHREVTVHQPIMSSVHGIQSLIEHARQKEDARQLHIILAGGKQHRRRSESITREEANSYLIKLAKRNPALAGCTREQLAEKVKADTGKSCSTGTISNTSFWKERQKGKKSRNGISRANTSAKLDYMSTEVRDLHEGATHEDAETMIRSSNLADHTKKSLIDGLALGKISASQVPELVKTAEEQEAETRRDKKRHSNWKNSRSS